jgi:hypothetical protein
MSHNHMAHAGHKQVEEAVSCYSRLQVAALLESNENKLGLAGTRRAAISQLAAALKLRIQVAYHRVTVCACLPACGVMPACVMLQNMPLVAALQRMAQLNCTGCTWNSAKLPVAHQDHPQTAVHLYDCHCAG